MRNHRNRRPNSAELRELRRLQETYTKVHERQVEDVSVDHLRDNVADLLRDEITLIERRLAYR